MNDHFRKDLTIDAPAAAVYAAITTAEGLRGWWTGDCDVDTHEGGKLTFRFSETHKEMRIDRLAPNAEVRWTCTGAHIAVPGLERRDEWIGTEIAFRLTPDGDRRTRLAVEHVGLVPTLDCWDLCDRGWRDFLGSLQSYVETGRGTPYDGTTACAH